MEDKKIVAELLGEATIGRLVFLCKQEKEAESLEQLLNHSIGLHFKSLSKTSYGPNGEIGQISLCRFNNLDDYCADITFNPAGETRKKMRYLQKVIGVVNLKNQTYAMNSDQNDLSSLYQDTEKVMQMIGLTKSTNYCRTSN